MAIPRLKRQDQNAGAGMLRRPSFRELFAPALRRTTLVTAALSACAYAIAFGRSARPDELREGLAYLQHHSEKLSARVHSPQERKELAWASFARALLASAVWNIPR